MSSVDLFREERQMVETVLDTLEGLAARLNQGEPLPNALLGKVVDFLQEFTDPKHDVSEGKPVLSGCLAHREAARVVVGKMQWALESLERGEAGAAGAFVHNARECIRLVREHMRFGDRFFLATGTP